MNAIVIKENNPLDCWKYVVSNFNSGVPCFLETEISLLNIEDPLFNRLSNEYKWHFRDTYRSFFKKMNRNLTRYEFSYYERMHDYFDQDQIKTILEKPNLILCNWDPNIDRINNPKPCFITAKIIEEGKFLNLSVTFRTRDIIKRMIPNFLAFRIMLEKICNVKNKKMGKLFDYSNQIIAKSQDIEKVKSWIEF